MKTRLLKRLREEARMHYSPMFLREFALSLGWSYTQANKYIRTKQRTYILRRVAELKHKNAKKNITTIKLLGIQMIDRGCANAEYIIRLRKE